jgi:hypothetical protein
MWASLSEALRQLLPNLSGPNSHLLQQSTAFDRLRSRLARLSKPLAHNHETKSSGFK